MPEYLKSTQQILKECEHISGYACDVVIDGSIPTYATVKMAGRNGLHRHQILVKENSSMLDYLVTWQVFS
ncbi:hypothetical protein EOL70_26250 [Leucothrix sargassi]|nr:hypothetical protein EOL70_26250 [Leucothrix sargassi]